MKGKKETSAAGSRSWCFDIHKGVIRPSGKVDALGVKGDKGEWSTGASVELS